MEETNTKEIQLVQKPIIKHQLAKIGKSVTERIQSLNLENQVVTDETIQSLKKLRADLNNEFAEYEQQRKALKEAVANPYVEFENVYKDEISVKYKNAVDILKDKISAFEIKLKEEKQAEIEAYFSELCKSEEIDFVKFNQVGITVNLSTSLKKYREQCDEFIAKVKDDIKLISSDEHSVEIMAEYKVSLNSSKAITDVRARKEREKAEKERQRLARTQRRESSIRGIAMIYNQMARSFYFVQDDSIFVKQADIDNLSDDEWRTVFEELKFSIESFQERQKQKEPVVQTKQPTEKETEPTKEPTKTPEPLSPPIVVDEPKKEEELPYAIFKVTGTMKQLMELSEYLKTNNLNYENLD